MLPLWGPWRSLQRVGKNLCGRTVSSPPVNASELRTGLTQGRAARPTETETDSSAHLRVHSHPTRRGNRGLLSAVHGGLRPAHLLFLARSFVPSALFKKRMLSPRNVDTRGNASPALLLPGVCTSTHSADFPTFSDTRFGPAAVCARRPPREVPEDVHTAPGRATRPELSSSQLRFVLFSPCGAAGIRTSRVQRVSGRRGAGRL